MNERVYTLHAYSKNEEVACETITGWEEAVKKAEALEETCDHIVLNLYGHNTSCYSYERHGDNIYKHSRPPVRPT